MPLLWLSLAFIAGILVATRMPLSTRAWLVIAGVSLGLALVIYWRRKRFASHSNNDQQRGDQIPFAIFLLPCALALGGARYQFAQPDLGAPGFVAAYNDLGAEVRVVGTISKPPVTTDDLVRLRLDIEGIQLPGEADFTPVEGLLLANVWGEGDWRYGDRVMLRGELTTPPEFEDFSYRAYLAQQGVYSVMDDPRIWRSSSGNGNLILNAIYSYKEHAKATLYRMWPDPEASIFAGILLGDESGISEDLDRAFKDTGTSHIIVISGFNITILVALLIGVFGRLLGRGRIGIFRGAIFVLIGIAAYTILVGADAAVVRAAIMGGMALFASLIGRRQDGLNTLFFVAAIMAAVNPSILMNIGFQLSFAATLGLILYAEPLKEAFERLASRFVTVERAQRWSRPVGEYILFTLAAQVLVLPIIVYNFQRLSLSSLIANPLILPAQPPVMILGGLALLAGTIYYPLGQLLGWLAWPFMAYTIRVVELIAEMPGGVLELGEVSAALVIAFYAILFGITFGGRKSAGLARKLRPGIALVGLAVLTLLVWRVALAAPDGRLHMTVLDVGTGDAILVQTPSGRSILIDGGPSTRRLSAELGRRLPFGRRQVDWLVIAAADEGQIGGLARNLERFPPQNVLWAGPTQGSRPARDLQERFAQMGIDPISARTGQTLELGEGAVLRLLAVGKRGAVLMLEWGNFRALLPIGLDFDLLDGMMDEDNLRGVTALLLAESGYAPVNPPEWIDWVHPKVVLLSVAAGDQQGLPSPETLEATDGYNLLRTDLNGWIKLSTDGEQMWVELERK
jgi:competence protein ComEC